MIKTRDELWPELELRVVGVVSIWMQNERQTSVSSFDVGRRRVAGDGEVLVEVLVHLLHLESKVNSEVQRKN